MIPPLDGQTVLDVSRDDHEARAKATAALRAVAMDDANIPHPVRLTAALALMDLKSGRSLAETLAWFAQETGVDLAELRA
ncbi:hypothetical protein [Phenylobacterium sp.]|uniref:hypothetical protein n=1 Tax=Phenylobacterium sp. TaxID=1871053 RepID=UPI0035B176D6